MTSLIKKFSLLLFVVLTCVPLFASDLDSLTQVLEKQCTTNDLEAQVGTLIELASYHRYHGNLDIAFEWGEKALKVAEKTGNLELVADSHNELGIISCVTGKNRQAISYMQKALEIYSQLENLKLVSIVCENIGLVYKDMGQYDVALEHQLMALEIHEENELTERLPNIYNSISTIYDLIGEKDKMKEYIDLALNAFQEYNLSDPANEAVLYNSLGNYLDAESELDSSIACYERVIECSEKIGWKRGIAAGLGNIAHVHRIRGEYDKAIVMHKQVLEIEKSIGNSMGIVEEHNFLAELFREKLQYDSALVMINHSIRYAIASDLLKELGSAVEEKSKIFEEQGASDSALYYFKEFKVLNDSITKLESTNRVKELEIKYQTSKKEQQLEIQHRKLKLQQIILGGIILVFIILSIVAFLVYRQYKMRVETRRLKAEQKLLRTQMNPHFIFNSLTAIQNMVMTNDPLKSTDYISDFARLMRIILEGSREERITLQKEIDFLNYYLELQKLRLNQSFDFEITTDSGIATDLVMIPPMLTQPFLENAIEHGVRQLKDRQGKIEVRYSLGNELLHISVSDNGTWDEKARSTRNGHQSFATTITKERIEVEGQLFKDKFDIQINKGKEGKGTQVEVSIPFEKI